jgi:anti-sigma factor RsiW
MEVRMSKERDESSHISTQLWERYALQQIPEDQLAPVEEHLLLCAVCQQRLAEIDEFVDGFKLAARQVTVADRALPGRRLQAVFRRPLQWSLPLSAAVFIIAVGGLLYNGRAPSYARAEVTLIASRGAAAIVGRAPAHTLLTLRVDAADISPATTLRAELVDGLGKTIWQAPGEIEQKQITARIGRPLDAGLYWLRLYDSARLLHEYGLQIK